MSEVTLIGIDLGKHVFHLHTQDRGGHAKGNPEAIDPPDKQLSKLHHRYGGLRRIALPRACASTRPLCEANRSPVC